MLSVRVVRCWSGTTPFARLVFLLSTFLYEHFAENMQPAEYSHNVRKQPTAKDVSLWIAFNTSKRQKWTVQEPDQFQVFVPIAIKKQFDLSFYRAVSVQLSRISSTAFLIFLASSLDSKIAVRLFNIPNLVQFVRHWLRERNS